MRLFALALPVGIAVLSSGVNAAADDQPVEALTQRLRSTIRATLEFDVDSKTPAPAPFDDDTTDDAFETNPIATVSPSFPTASPLLVGTTQGILPAQCTSRHCRPPRIAMNKNQGSGCTTDCVSPTQLTTRWNLGWRCGVCTTH